MIVGPLHHLALVVRIRRRKDLEEYRKRLEGEDVLMQPRFKAKEPPKTTTEPLFEKMEAEAQAKRLERRDKFAKVREKQCWAGGSAVVLTHAPLPCQESQRRINPFSGMEQRQREAERKAAEAKEKASAMLEHRLRANSFRAKDNPFKTDNKVGVVCNFPPQQCRA